MLGSVALPMLAGDPNAQQTLKQKRLSLAATGTALVPLSQMGGRGETVSYDSLGSNGK